MSHGEPNCKITVLKRIIHQDLIDEYLEDAYRDRGACGCLSEGEEFVIDPATMPEEFFARCPWAWADIRSDIMTIAYGANIAGMKQGGTSITACTDWLRPVYFKIERLDGV